MKMELGNLGAFVTGKCPKCRSAMFMDCAGNEGTQEEPTKFWIQCDNHGECGHWIPVPKGSEVKSVEDAERLTGE